MRSTASPVPDEHVLHRNDSLVLARQRLHGEHPTTSAVGAASKAPDAKPLRRTDSLALAHERMFSDDSAESPVVRERVLARNDSLTLARHRLLGEPKPGRAREVVDEKGEGLTRESSLKVARRRLSRRAEEDDEVEADRNDDSSDDADGIEVLEVDEEPNDRVLRRHSSLVITRRRLSSQKDEEDAAAGSVSAPPALPLPEECTVGLELDESSDSPVRHRRPSAKSSSPRTSIPRTDSLDQLRRRLSSSEKVRDLPQGVEATAGGGEERRCCVQ